MRDVAGALHSGPDGVMKAMTEAFDKLYGGETKLNDDPQPAGERGGGI
jgi:hypothetical protein